MASTGLGSMTAVKKKLKCPPQNLGKRYNTELCTVDVALITSMPLFTSNICLEYVTLQFLYISLPIKAFCVYMFCILLLISECGRVW